MRRTGLVILALAVLSGPFGCESIIPELPPPPVETVGDTIFIIDQAGERWDVTHAVRHYKMYLPDFGHGVGRNVIRPIIDPIMIPPGDRLYPDTDKQWQVIGTTINGDSRAYRIDHLNAHEVVDDSFGDVHVAVGW